MGRVETLIRNWFDLEIVQPNDEGSSDWVFNPTEVQTWLSSSNAPEDRETFQLDGFQSLSSLYYSCFRIRVGAERNDLIELIWRGVRYTPRKSKTGVWPQWTLAAPTFLRPGQTAIVSSAGLGAGSFFQTLSEQYGIHVLGTETAMVALSVTPNEQWWVLDSRPELFRKDLVAKIASELLVQNLKART